MEVFDQVVALIREFGFPTFVALWFMLRVEKRIDRQTELLASLMQATATLAKSVEHQNHALRQTGEHPAINDGEGS